MIIGDGKIRKVLLLLFKIFFIGLILQFFLQTFVSFELGWNNLFWKIIWSWKEIFILAGGLFLLYIFGNKIDRKKIKFFKKICLDRWNELKLNNIPIKKFIIVFVLTFFVTLIISLLIKKVGIGNYILSLKYNLFGFFIFILSFLLSRLFLKIEDISIVNWYNKLFKIALIGAFFWRIMVRLMPNFLKFFGYNQFNFEGTLGAQPPAAYYTMINQGLVRNQFLFERPISFGFFLVALRPVFFFSVLKGRSKKEMRSWSLFYGLIVFSTLSRASIGVWLLLSLIMIVLLNYGRIKKILWQLILPVVMLIGLTGAYFYKTSGERIHSNIGHIQLPLEGIKIIGENPIWGWGAGYAGPASHQICYNNIEDQKCNRIKEINDKYEITTIGFNPENQYVQIWMEYGLFGFLGRIIMFVMLHIIGYKARIDEEKKNFSKNIRQHSWIIIGFALGMLGLAIEGLVLHSFVDRMIVYPFMAMFGLVYALYRKESYERDVK